MNCTEYLVGNSWFLTIIVSGLELTLVLICNLIKYNFKLDTLKSPKINTSPSSYLLTEDLGVKLDPRFGRW